MTDRTEAISALLIETERAHGAYETAELGGVYDTNWPRWYAEYAVDHGIGGLVGHDVEVDRLATFLTSGFADFERTEPDGSWAAYLARRIDEEL